MWKKQTPEFHKNAKNQSCESPRPRVAAAEPTPGLKPLIVVQVWWLKVRWIRSPQVDNNFPRGLPRSSTLTHAAAAAQALPRQAAANCIVTLQICSGNQLGLTWGSGLTTGMIRILGGSPLVTWDRDESGITMKLEITCYCRLRPSRFAPVRSVLAFRDALKRCDCRRQSRRTGVWARNSRCPILHCGGTPAVSISEQTLDLGGWIMQFWSQFDAGLPSRPFDGLEALKSVILLIFDWMN